ncbi:MAG: hypothetical protein RIG82_09585 [Phycisphaeraceae bacterium]
MRRLAVCVLAIPLMMPAMSEAQEAMNTPAATQPGVGRTVVRERAWWHSFDDGTDLLHVGTDVTYGLTKDFSVNLHVPFVVELNDPGDNEEGFGDLHVMGKYRFLLHNPGPVDTLRASALFGVDIPTYDDDQSSDAFNSMVGVVATRIHGRHGVNGSLRYKLNYDGQASPELPGGSKADTLWTEGAYLYRLTPGEYTAETTFSTYLVFESSLVYETNGDAHLWVAPGFLYEAQSWAAGVSIILPAWQDLDHRPDLDVGIGFDLRFLF